MSNLKKLKKLYISLLIIIISIILGSATVSAVWFSSWRDDQNALWYSKDYYCAEHHDGFGGGTWIDSGNSWTITSESEPESYRILAHILKDGEEHGVGGYNGRGAHQIALWHWLSLYGLPYGRDVFNRDGTLRNFVDPGENQLYRDAAGAAKNKIPYSNASAKLVVNDKKLTMIGTVGALNIKEKSGDLENIEITWKDPTDGKEYKKKINAGKSKEDGWIEFYSDKECKKPININDFKVGTVYIKNLKENYLLKHINVHITAQASGFSVTVKRWVKNNGSTSQQDLISAELHKGNPTPADIPIDVEYAFGSLRIKKVGVYKKDGKAVKQENVTASFKIYCPSLKKWISGSANGNKTYVDSIDKATTYKSGATIDRLFASYKYQFVEVAVNNKYYNNPIKMVAVTSSDKNEKLKVVKVENGKYYASSSVVVSAKNASKNPKIITVLDERTSGDIKIVKVDDTHKEIALSGAKFKIYCKDKGWLVRNSDGTYKYDGDVKSATEFASNEKGEAQIKCVKLGTYYVYETVAPEGYDITKQDGYENKNNKDPYSYSKDNKWVYLGEVKLNSSNNTATYTFTNKKIVRLEGKVWLDKLDEDKASKEYDYVFTDKLDETLSGIKVNLHISKDVIIDTTTDKDGHYEFNNLNYWNLAESYIEFEYDNKKYVVVDPFVGNDTKINSKAIEEVMTKAELEDEKLTGTNGDNPGRAVTYKGGSNLNKTPLTGYYNNKTYTIEDINLGLLEKINPTMYVSENLQYVKIAINNYTYTYKYGDQAVTDSQFVPTVQKQNEISYSPTKLYPSDIAYNIKNPGGLQVYLVYSIDVKNNMTDPIDDIYNEGRLYLNNLEVKYDANRFTLSHDSIGNITNNVDQNKQFEMWEGENGVARYGLGKANDIYKDGLVSEEIKTSYIQLKAKNELINAVLEGGEKLNNLQKPTATQVFADGYHEYLRTDNVWVDDTNVKDFEGAKGTETYTDKNKYKSNDKYYIHKSLPCSDNSSSLSIKFELGKDRVLSGTVFEDIKEDNSALGNGKIDESEKNRAQNVKVELLDVNKEVTNLYKKDENKPDKVSKTQATDIYTSSDGNYKIEGVVPGYYYIRFTYGDGNQKMVDTNGKEVDIIKSNDYKSTIITNKDIQNAMEAKTQDEAMKLADWYKKQEARNNSTAVDNLKQRREAFDGYTYNADGTITDKDGNKETDIKRNINSYTPMIGISVEDDTADVKEIKHDEDGKDITEYKNEFTGFNFGLIKHPDTPVKVEKKITDVKFTNQVGTTLVSENPVSKQSTYVTDLDTINDPSGSKYAKLEIEPENIYGSNIELTYEIKITNNADYDDYTEESYYKYGESGKTKKTIQVQALEDDLDNKFNYASLPKTTTQTKSSESANSQVITLEPVTETINNPDETTTTKEYIKMTGWEKLAKDESTSTSYTVTALVANDDTDPAYNNDAKVQSLSVDTLTTLTTESLKKWEGDKTVFTITPTTGENRNQTYMYFGAFALAIIASGLVLIKKKVL